MSLPFKIFKNYSKIRKTETLMLIKMREITRHCPNLFMGLYLFVESNNSLSLWYYSDNFYFSWVKAWNDSSVWLNVFLSHLTAVHYWWPKKMLHNVYSTRARGGPDASPHTSRHSSQFRCSSRVGNGASLSLLYQWPSRLSKISVPTFRRWSPPVQTNTEFE